MFTAFQRRALAIEDNLRSILPIFSNTLQGVESFSYNSMKDTFVLSIAFNDGNAVYILVGPFEESVTYINNTDEEPWEKSIAAQYLMPHQLRNFMAELA